MFGNQQNRATNNYGNTRNERRASDIDDNSLSDDEVPVPNVLPQMEEHSYDSNQLGSGKEYDRNYPHLSRDLYYNMLLRNLELTQSLHNDPAYNLDRPFYNIMDSRAKREAGTNKKPSAKQSLRLKREYSMNPEDMLSLMKMWEAVKASRKPSSDSRNYLRWPMYETYPEDYSENEEENLLPLASSEDNGSWYDVPVVNPHSTREREMLWPRPPHKRFMVSKRQEGGAGVQYLTGGQSDYSDGIPLHRRFLL